MCGRDFGDLVIPFIAASVSADESPCSEPMTAAQANCPRCKAVVSPRFDWCPKYGQGLKTQPRSYCWCVAKPLLVAKPSTGVCQMV